MVAFDCCHWRYRLEPSRRFEWWDESTVWWAHSVARSRRRLRCCRPWEAAREVPWLVRDRPRRTREAKVRLRRGDWICREQWRRRMRARNIRCWSIKNTNVNVFYCQECGRIIILIFFVMFLGLQDFALTIWENETSVDVMLVPMFVPIIIGTAVFTEITFWEKKNTNVIKKD